MSTVRGHTDERCRGMLGRVKGLECESSLLCHPPKCWCPGARRVLVEVSATWTGPQSGAPRGVGHRLEPLDWKNPISVSPQGFASSASRILSPLGYCQPPVMSFTFVLICVEFLLFSAKRNLTETQKPFCEHS